MCLICVDFQKQRLTIPEARRAYREMVVKIGPVHAQEVQQMLQQAEEEAQKKPAPPKDP